MSLEPGGRSDKYGNTYENRFLARLLLRLVQEQISTVEVEPLGERGDGVEFITTSQAGGTHYYQCKASNGSNDYWRLCDLEQHDVFRRSRQHICRELRNDYYFISPLLYQGLDELCKRARTSSSSQDFLQYQLNSQNIKTLFGDYARRQCLDAASPDDLAKLLHILKHSYFEQVPSGVEAVRDLEAHCGMIFVGDASSICNLLQNYANDTGKYGVQITAPDIASYMQQRGFPLRNYENDNRVTPRIDALNELYWDTYHPIYNHLIPRSETETVLRHIVSGHSVILHGRAGSGKSGVVQELIQRLTAAGLPRLAIKLDKNLPRGYADSFGKQLGLPESPIFCLKKIAAGKPSVLILDQLDALRWTGKHSQSALEVCKEMILQAQAVNQEGPGTISIVMVSRTFDYENDPGIRTLFQTNDAKVSKWEEVRVENFTDPEVRQIVGPSHDSMPNRLKVLLRTPSSLFVWTNLQEQNKSNTISTITEMMDTWWNQIQNSFIVADLNLSDIQACMDRLVSKMEQSASFALPARLFQDQLPIIDVLVSSGLLVKIGRLISFTHQSFLDHFLMGKAISGIYDGKQITEFIGDEQKQTPNLRYRLLATLQDLCDADQDIFLEQCKTILSSNHVRFYYKCTVFEVLGQCETPSMAAIALAEKYRADTLWHQIVVGTVYQGHVPFIMHLGKSFPSEWLSDEGLALLASINTKAPDFVVDTLKPFCFQDADTDQEIFSALCNDANNDSDAMFALRLELLAQHPILFSGFWGLFRLFKAQSERAIPILKIATLNAASSNGNCIGFPDKEDQKDYAKVHFSQIAAELYPIICVQTADSALTWPQYKIEEEYQNWCASNYQESTARDIVSLVKFAFAEFAQAQPDEMLQVITDYHHTHSAVGHEIALSAIENLPLEQSDKAISWLLSDFAYNLFDYTSDTTDYLASTKRIIKKFSLKCCPSLFHQLEHSICIWKDDARKMVSSYRNRLEYNRSRDGEPAYWAYWGHLQKELLPCMEQSRLSSEARALLRSLNRNKWITGPHYYVGYRIGHVKSVVSPVHSYAEQLRDKTWIRIISSNFSNRHSQETASACIETDHDAFAHSLGEAAKKEPLRFAKLSLQFPDSCFWGYPYAVLSALCADRQKYQSTNLTADDLNLICAVIRRFWQIPNINIGIAIARLIESRATETWPDDILNILDEIALGHTVTEATCFPQTAADIEQIAAHSLRTRAINSTQGCAINAIAALLWEHPELDTRYRKILDCVCAADDPIVRYAAMALVYAFYNLDTDLSVQYFDLLLDADLRILAAPQTWGILWRSYFKNTNYYNTHLMSACRSKIEDLSTDVAGTVCAISIYSGNQALSEFVTGFGFTPKQQEKICEQAIFSFNRDNYHKASEKILYHLIDTSSAELNGFNRLFFDHCIDIERDNAFLVHLIQSAHSVRLVHTFLKYLSEQTGDITPYADVLKALSLSISKMDAVQTRSFVVDNFIQCIIRLFDQSKGDPYLGGVFLDLWDSLYASNLRSISKLADLIDQV